MSIATNDAVLEEKLEQLETVKKWSPRVISKLENLINSDDEFNVFRVNPIRFAIEQKIDQSEAIDLFLYTVKIGLFEMKWNMVCASCASVFGSFEHMSGIRSHFNCPVCKNENTTYLDDLIHVTFTVSPQIRDTVYNHPETLSAEDYYYKYYLVEGAIFPPDTYFKDILQQLTRHLEYIEPGEKKTYTLDLEPGALILRNVVSEASALIFVKPASADNDTVKLDFKFAEGSLTSDCSEIKAGTVTFSELEFLANLTGEIEAGKYEICIENAQNVRGALLILALPPVEPKWLSFDPFLSGKQVLSNQTFRDLFRSETIGMDEGIAIKDLTLMFTDLTGSTALYEKIGDPQALFVVQQHFATLKESITNNQGAIVKTIGDAVMATFVRPEDAVKAAQQSLKGIEDFNKTISEDVIVKIGIHCGHCIAVTLNDQQDYFGQTVNIAARVQGLAGPSEIYLSKTVYDKESVQEHLQAISVENKSAQVKGIEKTLLVYKILE